MFKNIVSQNTILYFSHKKIQKKCFKIISRLSFIDSPGHEALLSTMIGGSCLVDFSFLFIACNNLFPQSQTIEHLYILNRFKKSPSLIILTKIDLVSLKKCFLYYINTQNFLNLNDILCFRITFFSIHFIYIPQSLFKQCHVNINHVSKQLMKPPLFVILRSFNINKPNCSDTYLSGGVLGGSLETGTLKLGQLVEVRPGIYFKSSNKYRPIFTKIIEIKDSYLNCKQIIAGGLLAIRTRINASLTKQDRLIGHVLGSVGCMPPVYKVLKIRFNRIKVKHDSVYKKKYSEFLLYESLLINISSFCSQCSVIRISTNIITVELIEPICTYFNKKVTISKKYMNSWRIIAWGEIIDGISIEQV